MKFLSQIPILAAAVVGFFALSGSTFAAGAHTNLIDAVVTVKREACCKPEPEPFDLTVDSVEVTQATQTMTNSIPLVARRSTAVRAEIGVAGPVPVLGVTGRLHVFVNGVKVTPAGGVPPINAPFKAWGSTDRNKENDTLNFELSAPTAITASTDVDFRVDVSPKAGEGDTTNNSGSADDLTAIQRRTPFLYFARVDYTPSGLGLPDLSKIAPGTGDAFVRGILPIDDSDPLLYRGGIPSLTFSCDNNGDGKLGNDWGFCQATGTTDFESNQLLGVLEAQRQLIVQNGIGATDRVFLYGWLKDNPTTINGAAGRRVAFGNTEDTRYQRTFAHELLHNFGLGHNNQGLDEVGWDVGARLVNNPAGNNEAGRVKPITTPVTGPDYDVMNAGKLTNEAWINTTNYKFLLNHCTLLLTGCKPLRPFLQREVAVLRGSFDREGGKLISLQPVFRFPWESEPSELQEGRFVAEVTDTNGVTTTRRFDALVHNDVEGEESNGAFSVMLPVDPEAEIASLRITNADGTVDFAEMKRSEPPQIEIVSPQPGTALGGERTEVQWAVDDPDTPDSELLFEAAYSNDNGRSWVPIVVDIPGTERGFTFDPSQLSESGGEGIIRVFVSDGLNTAFEDVTGLTR
jgi:hypothetical protein